MAPSRPRPQGKLAPARYHRWMRAFVAAWAAALGAVLLAAGCRSAQHPHALPIAIPDGEPIAWGERSAFGSGYAGGTFLDAARSSYVPARILTAPGSLAGRFLAPYRASELIVEVDAPVEERGEDPFPDHFRLRVRDAPGDEALDVPFEAAYGAFALYAADVDGDGRDEVVLERGFGRGTCVYVRTLTVARLCAREPGREGGRLRALFEAPLNGYILGEPPSPRPIADPDLWERRYFFADAEGDGRLEIALYLLPPAETPRGIASAADTAVLQLPKLVYAYDARLETFALTAFELRPLR